jgi:hypothetical protein
VHILGARKVAKSKLTVSTGWQYGWKFTQPREEYVVRWMLNLGTIYLNLECFS